MTSALMFPYRWVLKRGGLCCGLFFRLFKILCGVGLVFLIGCAQTHVQGRDLGRVAPYRGEKLVPKSVGEAPLALHVSRQVLTDGEVTKLSIEGSRYFENVLASKGQERDERTMLETGEATLTMCRLNGRIGRSHTFYEAQCRAQISLRGAVLARSQGRAVRRVRNRGISSAAANEITNEERNPLYAANHSNDVLFDAIRAAAVGLVDPVNAPSEGHVDGMVQPSVIAPDAVAMRTNALNVLERGDGTEVEQAAAAVDLARWGQAQDGLLVVHLLESESPLVRRAALDAIGELVTVQATQDVAKLKDDPDASVRKAADITLGRLCAFILVAESTQAAAAADSSKSSGSGGGSAGVTPEDASDSEMWSHNAFCSNR